MPQAIHAARLALLEGALLGLLRGVPDAFDLEDLPDGIVVTVTNDPAHGPHIDVEYTRGGFPIAGESL